MWQPRRRCRTTPSACLPRVRGARPGLGHRKELARWTIWEWGAVAMIFSVYMQVGELERSLSFYRDALGMEVAWSDDVLAVLRGPAESAATLAIREVSGGARPGLGEAMVARIGWQVASSADLDSAAVRAARRAGGQEDHDVRPRWTQGGPVPAQRSIPGQKAATVHLLVPLKGGLLDPSLGENQRGRGVTRGLCFRPGHLCAGRYTDVRVQVETEVAAAWVTCG